MLYFVCVAYLSQQQANNKKAGNFVYFGQEEIDRLQTGMNSFVYDRVEARWLAIILTFGFKNKNYDVQWIS